MPIHILEPTVAAQIAAGEVVERPASVVKELVENALDAGASRISVEARGGGLRELTVRDDGCGIPAAEIELAFERHATSKLNLADDLWSIATLGFRGEALPSIASVAQVICISRAAHEEVGTELRVAGGEIQSRSPRGCTPGTSFSVRNLFYNTPVRREYLRSEASELSAISAVVQQYALAYPDVRFSLTLDNRLAMQTSGSGDLRTTMIELYGLELARQLLPVAVEHGSDQQFVALRGLLSPPGLTRGTRSYMHIFVNRRAIQARGAIAAVISEAYHTLLMKGRHPIVILDIEVHPAAVDVNVHPTKSEVKFRYQNQVFSVIGRAVREALLAGSDVPAWSDAVPDPAGVQRRFELRRLGQAEQRSSNDAGWQVGAATWDRQHSRWDAGAAPTDSLDAGTEQPPAPPSENQSVPAISDEAPTASGALPPLRVVGQVGLTYIIAEAPEGMYLIDQHAAHERITYERLMSQHGAGAVEAQGLLMPRSLALPADAVELLLHNRERLAEWGFELDAWGEGMVRLRAVPATLPAEQIQPAMLELVEYLAGRGGSTPADWREAMLITLSCHTSVRAGQNLSSDEMRQLLRQLEHCVSPRTCPHGRPTMILMTPAQLERQFGRRV